jgi:HAMP domain-containing protein
MSSCEVGIIVVAYVVIVLAAADFLVSRRIIRRLERIEELLTSTTKKNLRDGDNIANSDG